MAAVLVIGGTGLLGRRVVAALQGRGHEVAVLSRHADRSEAGIRSFAGDVRTGTGLAEALRGADSVVWAVAGRSHLLSTERDGVRTVLAALGDRHLVYASIVGVDRHRFAYYRAKREAELAIERSGARWTIQRTTQFHDFMDWLLSRGWFVATPHLAFQPVDVGEVCERLSVLVERGPSGIAPEFGGPEVLGIHDLAAQRDRALGSRTRLIPVPAVGPLADFDAGRHLSPEHLRGTLTWHDWLARRGAAAGASFPERAGDTRA
jgi:uncharacterized protein YbjT (DUF2867 family)